MLLAIDQGTTGTTVLLVDQALRPIAQATQEFPSFYPQAGWVEQHPVDIWKSVQQATLKCLNEARISAPEISAIGIANQRETTCLFTPLGEPISPFIVWQCKRSAAICERLIQEGLFPTIQQKTGLVIDPYFSATKILWLFENITDLKERAQGGEVLFGNIGTWLLHRLTNHTVHATDITNASRTMLMNLESEQFDKELLNALGIPSSMLPSIGSNAQLFGHTQNVGFLPDGIPICAMAGDQQAALFGQACLQAKQGKITYGTGSFLLVNTGDKIIRSRNGLLSGIAFKINATTSYCLEGSCFIAGAAIHWALNGLGFISHQQEIEALAQSVKSSNDVVFVPALAGLGAPHWRPHARGLICGLTQDTSKAHIARAILEGIALQNRDILMAMQSDGAQIEELRLDGGASSNDFLMQFQADILGIPCLRSRNIESTALGAAALAGIGCGLHKDTSEIKKAWNCERTFRPSMPPTEQLRFLEKWQKALERA